VRFSFFLREALGSIRRNWVMTMAAVITVFISTAILGAVLVTDRNLDRGATSLKNRVTIEVFIKDEAGPEGQQALEQKIAAMPEVKSFTYISKDEALERFKERYGDRIVQNLPINPLPASFEIQVNDADQVEVVAQRFFDDPNVDNDKGTTNGVQYAQATVRKMLGTINLVEKVMWGVTGVFGIAAVLLISTTVRLSIFARRREIEIMRLVGATNWFIRWPFVLEGFMTGLVGAVLAALAVWGSNWTIFNWIKSTDLDYLSIEIYPLWVQAGTWPLGMLFTLALLGAVLGAVGSIFAMRRYLRV
jgi:cell division transport system permease protein